MKMQPLRRARMKWLTLAQAYTGIVQFMEDYEWMELKITVLDDEAGPVGEGVLTTGFRSIGVGLNDLSLVETL